jgi:CheY-like chemotaxis protein
MALWGKHRILIVEDEEAIATYLQKTLNSHGYDAFATADSAETALARAAEKRPDIVLMDIHIRGEKDGIQTAAALREKYGVPVVFLTAFSDEVTVERAKETAPHGYVLKPVKSAELRQAVETALHLRNRPHALARFRQLLFQRLLPNRAFTEEAIRAYRERVWGKRDLLTWGLGLGGAVDGVGLLALGAWQMSAGHRVGGALYGVAGLGISAVCLAYLALKPWARRALFGVAALGIVGAVVSGGSVLGGLVAGISQQMLLIFLAVFALQSTRTGMAFRVEPTDGDLRVAFRGYCDNVPGQYGFLLALASLLLPPLAVVALPLSVAGWLRARRPDAEPLVALSGLALAGALVSLVAFAEMAVFAVVYWGARAH